MKRTSASRKHRSSARNHCWRALLRLVRVGAGDRAPSVPNSLTKAEAMAALRALCGKHCPGPAEVASARDHLEAFAQIVESYTGQPTTEVEVAAMFDNPASQGYRHTDAFRAKLAGMPWPPAAACDDGGGDGGADGPSTAWTPDELSSAWSMDATVRMMTWAEAEAEFERAGHWPPSSV